METRQQKAARNGRVVAKKMAATNPLLKELVKRFDLRLDIETIARKGVILKKRR